MGRRNNNQTIGQPIISEKKHKNTISNQYEREKYYIRVLKILYIKNKLYYIKNKLYCIKNKLDWKIDLLSELLQNVNNIQYCMHLSPRDSSISDNIS